MFLCTLPVDVSTAALPMQVPPTATALLPMDLRIVDQHHNQQAPFGLVSQHHPTPPTSTACPTPSEPGRVPVISKCGWISARTYHGCLTQTHPVASDILVRKSWSFFFRPPGAAATAGAGGSQTKAATPETAPDCRVSEAAWTVVTTTWGPAAGAYQGETLPFHLSLCVWLSVYREMEVRINTVVESCCVDMWVCVLEEGMETVFILWETANFVLCEHARQ